MIEKIQAGYSILSYQFGVGSFEFGVLWVLVRSSGDETGFTQNSELVCNLFR